MIQTIIAWLHTPGGILITLFSLILIAIVLQIVAKQRKNKTW